MITFPSTSIKLFCNDMVFTFSEQYQQKYCINAKETQVQKDQSAPHRHMRDTYVASFFYELLNFVTKEATRFPSFAALSAVLISGDPIQDTP